MYVCRDIYTLHTESSIYLRKCLLEISIIKKICKLTHENEKNTETETCLFSFLIYVWTNCKTHILNCKMSVFLFCISLL